MALRVYTSRLSSNAFSRSQRNDQARVFTNGSSPRRRRRHRCRRSLLRLFARNGRNLRSTRPENCERDERNFPSFFFYLCERAVLMSFPALHWKLQLFSSRTYIYPFGASNASCCRRRNPGPYIAEIKHHFRFCFKDEFFFLRNSGDWLILWTRTVVVV